MKNLFKKYYHSLLSPDEFSEFTDFMGDKKNDSIIFSLMKPYWDDNLNGTEVSSKTNSSLLQRIKEAVLLEKQKTAQRKINRYTWGLRVAAILVIGLLLSNIFFFQKSLDNRFSVTLQTLTTPLGAKTNITLPDGTIAWLNSGSTLTYPTKFSVSREVTLVGEAYFDVEKNNKDFIVSTNYGDVLVKGTSFNVKAYTDDNAFEITLEEGIVAYKAKYSLNELMLKPGDQLVKTEKGFAIKEVETRYFTSWKEGKLLFYKEPFPSFIKKLERWYNVKIEYTDPKLSELWYTGSIEMESISEVMEMINKAAPVNYSFNNKTRVFSLKMK